MVLGRRQLGLGLWDPSISSSATVSGVIISDDFAVWLVHDDRSLPACGAERGRACEKALRIVRAVNTAGAHLHALVQAKGRAFCMIARFPHP